MKRLIISLSILAVALLSCVAQDASNEPAQIEADVNRMLSAMRGKFSLKPHADRIAQHGGAAVPILIRKHDKVAEEKRWALVACLCRLPTAESCEFLMAVIHKHTNRNSTSYAIRHYPIQYEADIVEILIEILPVQYHGYTASERLRKIIFSNPQTAGKLVEALVDKDSSVPKNRQLHEILAHVSGYAHAWPNRTPDGRITLESENGFWRDWWKRNQNKEAFDWLIEALYRVKGGRRSHALQILGILNDKRAIPHFVSALNDKEYGVRYWAVVGLKKMEGTNPPSGYLSETFKKEEDRVIAKLKARFGKKTENKPDAGDGS